MNRLLQTLCLASMVFTQDLLAQQPTDEFSSLAEQRKELLGELQHLDRERREIQRHLKRLDKIAKGRIEIRRLERELDKAEEDEDQKKVEALGRRIETIEANLDHEDWLTETRETIDEAEHMLEELRELDEPELGEPLTELLQRLKNIRELKEQSLRLRALDKDIPESLEQRIENEEALTDSGFEHLRFLHRLREAFEEDDEGTVEEMMESFEKRREEEHGKVGLAARKKDRPPLSQVPTAALPIAISREQLAIAANVSWDQVVPQLQKLCFDCHDSNSATGDLDLESLAAQFPLVKNRDHWINVIEQVKNRVMPPEDGPTLENNQRVQLVHVLHEKIYNFDYSTIQNAGDEPARRLSHDEYDNTIRDLFGIDLKPTRKFPADMTGSSGFANSANTLFIQPLLMERYLGAAESIVSAVFPDEPKTAEQRMARTRLLGEGKVTGDASCKSAIPKLLRRAYRRPITDAEREQATKQFDTARQRGLNSAAAMRLVMQTTLVSPKFLMKQEAKAADEATRINDWELASRLSYFLWATMPDEELFQLAKRGSLSEQAKLSQQVDRMIADPRARTLGSVFAGQWLGSVNLGTRVRMDPIDNPWCTESLMAAMRDETGLYFYSLVADNQPLTKLVDGDYTFLNEELANHYRIDGVEGEAMRRVDLQTKERGGILGHGSLLAVTAFPGRTSPVVRGHWVLDTVLGTPPPPPPPNVSEFDEEIEESRRMSFREKLELHRKKPNCYGCHSQMDPIGFSLEGYDWFGRFRNRRGRMDTRGQLPGGKKFEGLDGLRQVIVSEKRDDLSRQLASKLLSYALGRQLEYYDEPALRKIIDKVQSEELKLQPLIHAIVTSRPFQYHQKALP